MIKQFQSLMADKIARLGFRSFICLMGYTTTILFHNSLIFWLFVIAYVETVTEMIITAHTIMRKYGRIN
jgi:hypothetical protein